jgi:hypothetical protein
VLLLLIALFSRGAAEAFGELLAVYILIGFIWAFIKSKSLLTALAAPFFYFIIHFAYGIGYIDGWLGKKKFTKR